MCREEIDVICLSETLMSASRYPELAGFSTFFRNRKKKAGGGIAILVRKEKARYAVKLETGAGDNEFLTVKFTNTRPHLVMIVYYGCQAKVGVDKIKLHLSQLMEVVEKYRLQGCNVNVTGDFNLQIGNGVIKQNHPGDNPCGRLFMEMLDPPLSPIAAHKTSDPPPLSSVLLGSLPVLSCVLMYCYVF